MQNEAGPVENVEFQLLEVVDAVASQTRTEADTEEDIPVDTAYTKRVMDDLDALLANLQSTTANISSYQRSQKQPLPSQPEQHQYSQELNHNYKSQYNPPAQGFQHSSQVSSLSSQNKQYNDYSSPNVDDDHVYQHQQIHSNVTYPGNSRDQENVQDWPDQNYPLPEATILRDCYHSGGGNSGSSTPPPLPPPPADILDYSRDFEQPVYEQHTFHTASSSTAGSGDTAVQQSTQVRDRGQRMSALSNNLSELDQLLQDLNSAQFMAEVDRKSSNASDIPVLNGTTVKQPPPVAPKPSSKPAQRTSVDNLLDQLEEVGSQPGRFPVDPNYQELSSLTTSHSHQHNGMPDTVYRAASTSSASSSSSFHQPQSASTATKELDELMMSLSEFRLQNTGDGAANAGEPAYAKPVKSRSVSTASPTSPHEPDLIHHQVPEQRQMLHQQEVQQIPRENGLEVMLEDLQSDLNRQGVNIKHKGVCAACQKPIVGQVIAALGRTWHVEHFVCAHCEEPLGTRNFYERDSLAYCEKDYHHLFAPRCAYCNGPIVDKCITALEKMWHPEHFFCAQCGRPFGEEDFHEKNGKAYCRDDYFQMFAPKCGGCAQPIMENYISALNRQWHPECFVCWDCRAPFGAGSFFDYEGVPYCETHYHAKKGSLCASCERPITGRCITAMFRKFHPEHFVCAFCLKQLNKGTFKEQNDKPYCHPCFVKLFG